MSLVALITRRVLLLRAKHLFVAAYRNQQAGPRQISASGCKALEDEAAMAFAREVYADLEKQ